MSTAVNMKLKFNFFRKDDQQPLIKEAKQKPSYGSIKSLEDPHKCEHCKRFEAYDRELARSNIYHPFT